MDLSTMRELFKKGALTTAVVSPVAQEAGWELVVIFVTGTEDFMTVAQKPRRKIYKSLEAAHLDAKRIGFDQVTTRVGAMQVA